MVICISFINVAHSANNYYTFKSYYYGYFDPGVINFYGMYNVLECFMYKLDAFDIGMPI